MAAQPPLMPERNAALKKRQPPRPAEPLLPKRPAPSPTKTTELYLYGCMTSTDALFQAWYSGRSSTPPAPKKIIDASRLPLPKEKYGRWVERCIYANTNAPKEHRGHCMKVYDKGKCVTHLTVPKSPPVELLCYPAHGSICAPPTQDEERRCAQLEHAAAHGIQGVNAVENVAQPTPLNPPPAAAALQAVAPSAVLSAAAPHLCADASVLPQVVVHASQRAKYTIGEVTESNVGTSMNRGTSFVRGFGVLRIILSINRKYCCSNDSKGQY